MPVINARMTTSSNTSIAYRDTFGVVSFSKSCCLSLTFCNNETTMHIIFLGKGVAAYKGLPSG